MIEFYRSVGGQRFIESTVPNLVLQIQRIANSLDRLPDLVERAERAPADAPKEGT